MKETHKPTTVTICEILTDMALCGVVDQTCITELQKCHKSHSTESGTWHIQLHLFSEWQVETGINGHNLLTTIQKF
jgi:hypothetical protein